MEADNPFEPIQVKTAGKDLVCRLTTLLLQDSIYNCRIALAKAATVGSNKSSGRPMFENS